MFRITALLAVLVLGSSASAALASNRSYDTRSSIERPRGDRIRVDRSYDRFDSSDRVYRGWNRGTARDDFGPRRYRSTWVALSAPQPLGRFGQEVIEVRDRGTFTQLRLQTDGGAARIERVIVQFADGSDQVVETDRVLDEHGELMEIQLDGNNRRIDRIVVEGATRGSALQVFGI